MIMGSRAGDALRDEVIAVLGHADFQHVSLLKAVADQQGFDWIWSSSAVDGAGPDRLCGTP
jgi:hypothetical protein